MMTAAVTGLLPILHTPFTAHDEIDQESLQREIDWCFELGVDGVCSAMVSELLRLTPQERVALTELMVNQTAGRGAVIASIGAESTKDALFYGKVAQEYGCDAVMAIPPINTSLPEAQLWDYYCTLVDQVQLPLIVQDASSYVGQELSLSFYLRLLEKYGPEKILFKPESSPIGPKLSEFNQACEGKAKIFDGSGGLLLVDCYRRGLTGTMPGCDLLDGVVALWQALKAGDDERAYQIYFPICAIVALQLQAGLDGFLAIEKHIMQKRKIFTTELRRKPYAWELDQETRAEVDRLLVHLERALAN